MNCHDFSISFKLKAPPPRILAAIRRTSPELTSPSSCSTDLRMSAVSVPWTPVAALGKMIHIWLWINTY